MRVLITGGLGFIGSWTARNLLEGGHGVRTFDFHDRRELFDELVGSELAGGVEHVRGDITEPADVDAAVEGCDAAVHLAGVLVPGCREDPVRGARVNVLGTLYLFQAAIEHDLKGLSYASTAAVFGPDSGTLPLPVTHYGAYKLCNEGTARAFAEDAAFSSVGLRPFTVYGPGREIGITAGPTLAMRAAAEGRSYTIPFIGSTGMDFVGDTAAIFARAATETPSGAHVFSLQGTLASIDDILAAIRAVIPHAAIEADGPHLPIAPRLDEGDLRSVFPNLPRTTLDEGTRLTIEFYQRKATPEQAKSNKEISTQ
ncbi:MAG TPA: NAD(P)-dependent oxidoreductase [Candidatus Baltobacteraceae bacterium]|nr:NAD(P)-dependent oxidoreductase [Candidatus Baltobacteraceae bacterium]